MRAHHGVRCHGKHRDRDAERQQMPHENTAAFFNTCGELSDRSLDVVQCRVCERECRKHEQRSNPDLDGFRDVAFCGQDVQECDRWPMPEIERVAALSEPLRRTHREQRAIEQCVGSRDDHQDSTEDRCQRCDARPAADRVDVHGGHENHRQPGCRDDRAQRTAQHQRQCPRRGNHRTGQCDQSTNAELPCA